MARRSDFAVPEVAVPEVGVPQVAVPQVSAPTYSPTELPAAMYGPAQSVVTPDPLAFGANAAAEQAVQRAGAERNRVISCAEKALWTKVSKAHAHRLSLRRGPS